MLAKYSSRPDAIRELEAASFSPESVMIAVVFEHGGVVGCPVSNERWLFLSREPPEDRVGIEPEHPSPEWEATVVNGKKNWYVVFFIVDRAVASSLGEALVTGGEVDAILDRSPEIVGCSPPISRYRCRFGSAGRNGRCLNGRRCDSSSSLIPCA
jgi:hypothetical protein